MGELINHLWQSTVFAVLAGLTAMLLQRNQAATRYWLWLAASLKFLVPFSWLATLGTRVDSPATVPMARAVAVEQITASFAPAPYNPVAAGPGVSWILLGLVAVWAIGMAVLAVRWYLRWRSVDAAFRSASQLEMDVAVPVLSSREAVEPGIFGIFRPVLLMPEGIEERLTAEEMDAIVAHELCHVRRRDNLMAALHMVVETVFWFHPLIWRIGAKLIEERERACDEEVLRLGKSPEVYAQGILQVCRMYLESPLPCASGVTGADLKLRIREILSDSMPAGLTGPRRGLLACLCLSAIAAPVLVGVLNGPRLRGQDMEYKFEVASIKPTAAQGNGTDIHTNQTGLRTSNTSLFTLIQLAYGVQNYQISGGPGWVRDARFDVTAKYEQAEVDLPNTEGRGRAAQQERLRSRVRNLLAERFQLKLREEMKDLPVYGLVIDKGGHKLKVSTSASSNINTHNNNGTGKMTGAGVPVKSLSGALSSMLGRPVNDETGLSGLFEFEMNWSDNNAADAAAGPTIYSAIREQLGLRLDSKKGPVVTYVIERAEKPSEN